MEKKKVLKLVIASKILIIIILYRIAVKIIRLFFELKEFTLIKILSICSTFLVVSCIMFCIIYNLKSILKSKSFYV